MQWTPEENDVTCEACRRALAVGQEVPGSQSSPAVTGAACECGHGWSGHAARRAHVTRGKCRSCPCREWKAQTAAPPSRSEAEARPLATGKAEEVRPCGACGGPLPYYRDAVCERCTPEAAAHAVALSMGAPERGEAGRACPTAGEVLGFRPCGACEGPLPSHRDVVCEACHPESAAVVGALTMDPVGSLSDGMGQQASELRPCCPDAGSDRCHGQPWGACRCRACVRAERGVLRENVNAVASVFPQAALSLAMKRYVRRQFARLVTTLRGRAQAAEARRSSDGRVDRLEALVASQAANLSRLVAEVTAAQNQRDDALIQASAAAERAHRAESELERAREELEAMRDVERVLVPEWTGPPTSEMDGLEDES